MQLNLILVGIFDRIFQLIKNLHHIYNHHLFLINIYMQNPNFILFWLNDNSVNLINFALI